MFWYRLQIKWDYKTKFLRTGTIVAFVVMESEEQEDLGRASVSQNTQTYRELAGLISLISNEQTA
jgi:hypothetical protein